MCRICFRAQCPLREEGSSVGQREMSGCDTGLPKPQPTPQGDLGLKWSLQVVLCWTEMAKTCIAWVIVYPGKGVPQPRRLFTAGVVPGGANNTPRSRDTQPFPEGGSGPCSSVSMRQSRYLKGWLWWLNNIWKGQSSCLAHGRPPAISCCCYFYGIVCSTSSCWMSLG